MYWQITLGVLFLLNACMQLLLYMQIYYNVQTSKYCKNIEVLDVHQLKFEGYLKDFNKRYTGEEYGRRFENFKASLKEIARFNALEQNTVFGLTKFSDMSKREFSERMLMKVDKVSSCPRYKNCNGTADLSEGRTQYYDGNNISTSFDWRKEGVVKPVLNQKLCLGCWAFSIIGVMESMSAIRKKDCESRSIQELLDCSEDNDGCRLGSVSIAMDFLCNGPKDVVTADEYPLTLADQSCRTKINKGRRVLEYAIQCNRNETEMLSDIANHGPLVAAVDATNWQNYISGVIRRTCNPAISTHVIQIVGYNKTDGKIPYYIIRNSYGEDFGEQGYVRVAINGNVCGIADQVTVMDVF